MYAENGMSIRIDITKWEESGRASVGIAGYIEKGASRIDFSVLEQASPDHVEVVERLTGIDFILGLFELVYRESQIKADVQRKQDEQIRKTVNKAIDDILFG